VLRGTGIDVSDGEAEWRSGRLQDGSFVAPWLTIVRWRATGEHFDRTVAILPDMIDAARFRELRVLLKTGDRSLVPLEGTLGTDLTQ
jgi:hypothetical protein